MQAGVLLVLQAGSLGGCGMRYNFDLNLDSALLDA